MEQSKKFLKEGANTKEIKDPMPQHPSTLLEKARVSLAEKLEPPPPVLQIDNKTMNAITIFTKGNISVIKGRAKARKSFAVAMLAAAAISKDAIYSKFIPVNKDKSVVYFDTEQSSFYVQQAISRVMNLIKD